ncbi:tetratricopeptide repeat protein [Nonomuraea glycinis]|uniref:SARP family transcriptional regulator n=1 Tax=Nonomuraea glycinis TaxID=2047744 RepID=A0A918A214_9ACTN|nr:BTAD domain-containing putative transcriptional regulator [Nonomuraea glycinis]MCA2183282.1 tetratricopeptide repeat protein [Nonomuraea glycinis]GGP04435.1 SARP family transcriptional regulator [Nonomuraea glycinis]
MRFDILGPTEVRDDGGAPVALGGPRVRALLALLALESGRIVDAERLVDLLYGTRPPGGVANALQSQVSRLRRALGRDRVEFHPSGYRLVADPLDVDAHRFERLAAEGGQALAGGDPHRAAALLREGLELWRGAPLADAPHAEAAAARLAELRLAAIEDRVQAELELGRHRELVAELTQLTAAHPLRERPRAQLMRALYGSGRQAEALAAFDEGRRILDEELGVEPGTELTAVHLAVLRADPSLGTPGGSAVRQGVRAQLTSFVGRAEELRQVRAELAGARLVTLIGPGGAGKTRLAVEAAGRIEGDVCVVQLAPVADGAEVPLAVLAGLEIRDRTHARDLPAVEPTARLVTALADRELLLVLDNCEHLIEAAAALADTLLAACPALRVLATSREALGITGECILPVAPLRVPPRDAADPLAYAAARLFADRAAAVRQAFEVNAENAAQVIQICRALDGLPLAIELAAARLRALSLSEVAARLDDRFRLLTRGSRTALPRHQTLRAVVAWSWDLLDDGEQTLARRLTVFAGGATPRAAERVCGLPEDVLFSLAEKSLVEVVDGRYRMLRTIRAFCAEQLAAAGEAESIQHAHAAYYLDLVNTADPHLRTAEQLDWLTRLDKESDDLTAAVRWAIESGPSELALRLVALSACYWWMRGHRAVSAHLATDLLARLGDRVPAELNEEYVMCVLVAVWSGDVGEELAARLNRLRGLLPDQYMPPRLEFLSILLPMFTGPPSGYDLLSEDSHAIIEQLPPWSRALTHCGSGFILQMAGRPEEARAAFERSLAAFRRLGERWGTMLALSGLGDLAFDQGDYASSSAMADEALKLSRELGAMADVAENLCRRADAVARTGDPAGALEDYRLAARLSRRIDSRDTLARAHCGLGELALAQGDLGTARRLLEQARAECPDQWYSAGDLADRIAAGLARLGEPVSER